MMQKKAAFWEKGYADMGVSTMGGPNHDIVELAAAVRPGSRVLDLGCGEGRNAFYLATRGCRVKAVDISEHGIKKLAALAEQAGLAIETEVADLATYKVEGVWDLVLCHGVIDYLDNATWRKLLTNVKQQTAPGGFNAYTCMLFTAEYPAGPEFIAGGFKHSLAQEELADFYNDWRLVRHDRYVKWDQHPGIPIHCHPVDKVVAQKPGPGPEPISHVIPTSDSYMPEDIFDAIDMGMPVSEMHERCGEPDVVDRVTMNGVQIGVGPHCTVDGYLLSLWYYGRSVMYVVNDKVWGRAIYNSPPIRVSFKV